MILETTLIVNNLIDCCDIHLGKFPSTKLNPVIKQSKIEKIKAISEMCAEGNNFKTFAHSCVENFKTIWKQNPGDNILD